VIIFREAVSAADLEIVRTLLREYGTYLNRSVGAQHICLESYEQELAGLPAPYQPPTGLILLALVDEKPAGVIALKPLKPLRSLFPDERACEMKRLWVSAGYHGLGLGKKLSEELMARAAALGYTAIYLDTMPKTMQNANHIYAQLGFTPVERYTDNLILRLGTGCEDNSSPEVVFFRRPL